MLLKSIFIATTLMVMPLAAAAGEAKIKVLDAYARASTPTSKSGAIFFEIKNHGAADRLTAAATTIANSTQLHTHSENSNGVMRMIHVEEGFEVPAGGSLIFARGGHHVMLLGLTGSLVQGDTVALTLTFEMAGDITIDVPVDLSRKPKTAAHGGHGDAHLDGHSDGHGHGHSDDASHSGHSDS